MRQQLAQKARRRPILPMQFLLFLTLLVSCNALGGEKASFDTPQMSGSTSHRQNVCHRYQLFQNGTVGLKDALKGMHINVLMSNYDGAFFDYNDERGIHPDYPGLMAVLLDEVGRRAKFTWRDSFGISTDPGASNATWTELLLWGIDHYDISADWWAQNLERMNMGVAFLKEWYDSSIILISKAQPEVHSTEINYWNWTNPYDGKVWITTILTVFLSGIVYQILEWFADDRQDRDLWEWWQQNQYLSAINFTQAYEYQPKTFSTRLFGISMAIWALVMTATYTANLASLLVDRKPPPLVLTSIEEIAVFGQKLCTWEGTNSDTYVKDTYPTAIRIPKTSLEDLYDGLHNGECDFVVETVASWSKAKAMREYNPRCDLFWAGTDRKINEVVAGFATKADSGRSCTGLIRDVVNLHMHDMIQDGFLEQAWVREYKKTQDINCNAYRPEVYESSQAQDSSNNSTGRRRLLRNANCGQTQRGRILKGAGKGAAGGAVAAVAASAGGNSGEAQKLNLEQMLGTFVLHWGLMVIALFLAATHALFKNQIEQYGPSFLSGSGNTKGTEAADTRDEFDDFDSNDILLQKSKIPLSSAASKAQTQREIDLQKQLESLRLSQTQMQEFQQGMLAEQRSLRQQVQTLLQVISSSQMQNQKVPSPSQNQKVPSPPATPSVSMINPSFNSCCLLRGEIPADSDMT